MERTRIQVDATGSATKDFDYVVFEATVRGRGENSVKAKQEAALAIGELRAVIEEFGQKDLGVDPKLLQSSFDVRGKTRYNNKTSEQEDAGYEAAYTITFRSEKPEKASEIFDRLTSIAGVQARSPSFRVRDLDEVTKQAKANAYGKAVALAGVECEIMGRSFSEFSIVGWYFRVDQGGVKGVPAESEGDHVQILAGKAKVSVRLTVHLSAELPDPAPMQTDE